MNPGIWLVLGLLNILSKGLARMPLKADWDRGLKKTTPGCKLGGKFYELEEKWSPELEPVGVMFCVKCQCLPVIKKGVLSQHGKVECRNIKNQCPEPKCDDPEIRPGMCCKSCPGDGADFEDVFKGTKLSPLDKDATVQGDVRGRARFSEFKALLVGKHVRSGVSTRGVAWGRFFVEKNTLRFSISYSRMRQLRYIRFVERDGTVLHEQKIHPRADDKHMVCGVWPKLASIYKDFLSRGYISVVLTTAHRQKGEVAGWILPEESETDETFITLLNPSKKSGAGAAMLLTYHHKQKRVHYRVYIEGLLPENDYARQVLLSINKGRHVLERTPRAVTPEGVVDGVWEKITRGEAKKLARGKLTVRVISEAGDVLKGSVMPRQSCSTYQATLSGSLSLESASTSGAGAAVFSLLENGRIGYKIRLVGLSSKVTKVRLEGAPNRKNKRRKLADLTSNFVQDESGFSGWVNGTYKKPKALDTYMLLNEFAYINVATETHKISEIRGHVTELGYREHTKHPGDFPIVLAPRSVQPSMTSGTAGNAWFGFDSNCVLHYEIVLEGITIGKGSTVAAQLSVPPLGGEIPVLSNRHSVKTFGGFSGNKAVGVVRKISEDLYKNLDDGKAVLQVASMSTPLGELRGNVTVRNKCWRLFGDHDSNMVVDEQGNRLEEVVSYSCEYEGQFYDDGSSWVPDVDSVCNTCSCKRGKVKCHKEVCPVLSCANPVHVPGQCCASCPALDTDSPTISKEDSCYFSGDKRWHPIGTSWHPYIPPFGYVTCAVCNCVPGGEVSCSKITCPKLDCPDAVAVRKNEMDCCKVCPTYDQEKQSKFPTVDVQSIQGDRSTDAGACMFAGKKHDSGSSWHPYVSHFGAMKCITCKCNEGKTKCKRQKCPRLKCLKKEQVPGECCPKCSLGGKHTKRHDGQGKSIEGISNLKTPSST
ncbi:chordin-like [Liolophura sinensis]|uniref:chordin-like n=1 Tax=Liolophura sinensis TaxID=3198878 RepID=UPI0031593191